MENNAPIIPHWSYSSMTQFMRDRLSFKKKYIMHIFDDPTSPAAVVGKAAHKAMEMYLKGLSVDDSIREGIKEINETSDMRIEYGKTGSREKILQDYTKAINGYISEFEMPAKDDIIGIELALTENVKDREGNVLSIPAKAVSDLVVRNSNGGIDIIDHKFVSTYTDGNVDDPIKLIQAMFNFHVVEAKFGEAPARMIYNEYKISVNKNHEPQLQQYVIEFNNPQDFAFFYNLYNDVTREILKPDLSFLPNFSDMFDGKNSFEIYRQGIIGVEAPIAVAHKTEQKVFVEKNYVASANDSIDNLNLSPEEKIRIKFQEFGIPVEMQKTHVGASITQYTLKTSRGVKMSQFDKYANDIALVLKAHSVRIEAPIRGTDLVGIEVPSLERKRVDLTEKQFKKGTLSIPIGQDVNGKTVFKDLVDMPHLLVAGATGAGKSVFLNSTITALTEQMTADELELVLIDPKRVELSQFRKLPHLNGNPIIFEESDAAVALDWLVDTMEQRYKELESANVRSIDEYAGNMKKIVVVIDEFADLILQGDNSMERSIIRIAQKARAIGIHLILATQRPSVDVVTGLIKANIPTKVAFMTTSKVNSMVILDQTGAEELTGKGDMLFLDPSKTSIQRLQGFYK